jgi:hypothetical protein
MRIFFSWGFIVLHFISFQNKVSCPCKRVKENKGFLDSGIAFLIVFLNLNPVVLLALCCGCLVAKHYGFFKTLLIKKNVWRKCKKLLFGIRKRVSQFLRELSILTVAEGDCW